MKIKIKVKRISDVELPKFIKVGDWVDLSAAEPVYMLPPQANARKKKLVDGEWVGTRDVVVNNTLIPLGIAMELPKGYEAIVAPRSSTFKHYGIIQSNSIGVIDQSYNGETDEWKMPVIALKECSIPMGARVCQFRIQLSQRASIWQKIKWLFTNKIEFVEVPHLNIKSRGGFGSTNE